jgi:hypothetical protein
MRRAVRCFLTDHSLQSIAPPPRNSGAWDLYAHGIR